MAVLPVRRAPVRPTAGGCAPGRGTTDATTGDGHRRHRHEGGFAILEVVMAVTVLVISLLAVSSLIVTQSASISSATMQQVAEGLLTQALDEVRAMPFSVVANGLSNSDSTIATDPNITISGTSPNQTYTFTQTGETIPHSSVSYTQAPFVPHMTTTTINKIAYTVAAYPTIAGTGNQVAGLTPLSQPSSPPATNGSCTTAAAALSPNGGVESLIGNVDPAAGTEVAAGSWFSFVTTDESPLGTAITGYSDPSIVLDGSTTITPTVIATSSTYASGISYVDSNAGSTGTNCPYLVEFQIPSSLSQGSHSLVVTTYDSDNSHDTFFWPFSVGPSSSSTTSGDEYRVTVIVSWSTKGLVHSLSKIEGQTLVYSPVSGCLSSSNVPLQASCPPLFYTTDAAGGGSITVSAASGWSGNPIANLPFSSILLSLASANSSASVEQIANLLGAGATSGASLTLTTGTQSTGSIGASSSASNDPGISHSVTSSGSGSQSEIALQATGSGSYQNWITATPGTGDTDSTTSTADATSGGGCDDLTGAAVTTALPCAYSSSAQSGTAATINMGLYAGSSSLGTVPLASVGAQPSGVPDRVFGAQFTSSGGSYCASTSGNGCIHAGGQDALGTIALAGLPAQFLTDGAKPSGWGSAGATNYLLALTNYSAQATAESGVGAGSPTATVPASGQATPTLSYWNGSGYTSQSFNFGGSAPSITIPNVSVTDTHVASGSVTVAMGATVTLGATSTSTSTPSGCTSACTATATVSAPLKATITYKVTQGATTIADVQVAVVLGTIAVSTSYQVAP